MSTQTEQQSSSKLEQESKKLLERALAQPGIRESMIVYGNWQEKNRGMSSYRSATKKSGRAVTTNSSNALLRP